MIEEHEKRLNLLKGRLENLKEETPTEASKELQTDLAVEASQKPIVATEKELGQEADRPSGPVGIDIGTTHIAVAQNQHNHINLVKQLNAFFTYLSQTLPERSSSKTTLHFLSRTACFTSSATRRKASQTCLPPTPAGRWNEVF